MNIGSIIWPNDARSASKLYLEFLIKVVEALGLTFSKYAPDPLITAKKYISGSLSDEEYRASADKWWDHLDNNNATRDFQSRDALTARIAICLLTATPDEDKDLGEHLSWFFEMLEKSRFDMQKPSRMMLEHFGLYR